jgi:abortive infection bacteriophage resistance protein
MLNFGGFFIFWSIMLYSKPALTFQEQAEQLISRGMKADVTELIATLSKINYYRLSGYWHPFREYPSESFKKDTNLTLILYRYEFDQKVRNILLEGIEPIEIYLRTHLTYFLSHHGGAFAYLDSNTFPDLTEEEYIRLISDLRSSYGKSKETFALHFQKKYGEEHDLLPIWMVTELMTFGNLLTAIRGMKKQYRQTLGKEFVITDTVIMSWLRALNGTRNICAHHGRIWNRGLGYKPMIPNKDSRWKVPEAIIDNRIFAILTIIIYMHQMIGISPDFKSKIKKLLNEFPQIPLNEMGFPQRWAENFFWRD